MQNDFSINDNQRGFRVLALEASNNASIFHDVVRR